MYMNESCHRKSAGLFPIFSFLSAFSRSLFFPLIFFSFHLPLFELPACSDEHSRPQSVWAKHSASRGLCRVESCSAHHFLFISLFCGSLDAPLSSKHANTARLESFVDWSVALPTIDVTDQWVDVSRLFLDMSMSHVIYTRMSQVIYTWMSHVI